MTQLTNERDTIERNGVGRVGRAAADVLIYKGALTVIDAQGHVHPAHAAAGLKGYGRAEATIDNRGGAAGELLVPVKRGVFRFDNSAADPIGLGDIGAQAYAVDDATVAKTDGGGARSAVAVIFEVDEDGVWIEF